MMSNHDDCIPHDLEHIIRKETLVDTGKRNTSYDLLRNLFSKKSVLKKKFYKV